jgi:hypothetical protein
MAGCATAPADDTGSSSAAVIAEETVETYAAVAQVTAAFAEAAAQAGTGEAPAAAEPAAGCTRAEWTILDPLRLTLHFDGCVTPAGETLDGRVTGWLQYDGVDGAIGIAVDDLSLGTQRLDGFLVLATDGPDATLIDASISLENDDGSLALELDARFSTAGGVLQLDGTGAFEKDGDAWTAAASAVRWEDPGACHPTAGALDLTAPGLPPTHVTLRSADMLIQVGSFPAFPHPYPACR